MYRLQEEHMGHYVVRLDGRREQFEEVHVQQRAHARSVYTYLRHGTELCNGTLDTQDEAAVY